MTMQPSKTPALGVPVDAISFEQAQSRVLAWGHAHESRYVVLANVHVVVTASTEPDFGAVVAAADLATPDGAPVAWILRKLGHAGQGRVSGPDLTWALLGRCEAENLPVYFFGSSRETLGLLAERINTSGAGLVFVGLGCPLDAEVVALAVLLCVSGRAQPPGADGPRSAHTAPGDGGRADGVFAVRYGSGGFGAVPRQVRPWH